MRFKRIAYTIVVLLLVGGVAGYFTYYDSLTSQQQKQKQKQKGKKGRKGGSGQDEPVPVLMTTAKIADVPVYLDGVGTARALNMVTVKPQVDGKLITVFFTEGMDVEKGYVLAKIDPTIFQAQYDQAVAKKAQDEAQLANAKLDLERYQRLAASNAINKQQLDTQRALVDQLSAQTRSDQAAIDNTKAVLEYTNIVAPISGRTGIRLVDEGNIVRQADTTGLVVITQVRPIAVLFNLPQQELPELTRGMGEGQLPVRALDAEGKVTLDNGKVLVIDNQVDQTTGTVKLKAEFPNDKLQLWPGQFVNIRLLIDTLRQVVVAPTAAVQRGPNGTFVYIINDDETVTVRPVTVGQQDDLQAVIKSGLQVGERIVTTGFGRLAEGAEVEATSAEEAGQISATRREGPRGGKRGEKTGEEGGKAGGEKGGDKSAEKGDKAAGKGEKGGKAKGAQAAPGGAPSTTP